MSFIAVEKFAAPALKGENFISHLFFTQIFLSQIICIISTFNERLSFLKSKITPLGLGKMIFDFCREICCHDPKGSRL